MKNKLLCIFIFVIASFIFINASATSVELYNENMNDNILSSIKNKWITSSEYTTSVLTAIMDGEDTEYKYLAYWSSTADTNKNDYLRIKINNLNIDTSKYTDIRISIETLTALVKHNGLIVYTYDAQNKKHGPYYVDDYGFSGYFKHKTAEKYYRGYSLVTDSLKDSNYVIKSIEIIPYGNFPLNSNPDRESDVRHQLAVYINSIKVIGYTNETYSNPNTIYTDVDVNTLRLNIASRMYDYGTIKWIPSMNMASIFSNTPANLTNVNKNKYKAGEIYYGPPYMQNNQVPIETFYSILDSNKKYPTFVDSNTNLQSLQTPGAACNSTVYFSLSKYIAFPLLNSTTDFIWNSGKTTVLGGLNMDGQYRLSSDLYDDLCNQYLNNTTKLNSTWNSTLALPISRRIKSNDSRMWYNELISDNGEFLHYLGYSEVESTASTPAIDGDAQLKIYVGNLGISANKKITLKFNYFIKNGTSEKLNKNDIIVKFCSSSTCYNATAITTATETTVNSGYERQTVTVTYTPTVDISRVEIYPYGTEEKQGRVFRLDDILINLDGTKHYYMSASGMKTYFKINTGSIKQSIVSLINGSIDEANKKIIIARFLAEQDIYKGYSELTIGDIVSMYRLEWTHVMLITGNTHVVCLDGYSLPVSNSQIAKPSGSCSSHIGIDEEKSYYIRTDIKSDPLNSDYDNRNEFGGLINSSDYTAASVWKPNVNYTDVKAGDIMNVKRDGSSTLFLQNKNVNFHINYKEKFDESFDQSYIPITLNAYLEGKTEKPYAEVINANSINDIKDGIKGTVYSNYTILSLRIVVYNFKTGINYSTNIFPTHESTDKEGLYSNYYSLYYNLSDDVKSSIASTIGDSDNYLVKVIVRASTETSLPALELSTSYKLNTKVTNLGISSKYTTKVYDKNSNLKTSGNLATGDTIEVYLNDTLITKYTAIVKGDVTGNGTTTVSDVAKLYQYLKGKITMDDIYVQAGNVVSSDSIIKVNDVAKLYQFVKGKISSL